MFVTYDYDPFKLNKMYFAKYSMYFSEIFTHDVNTIKYLFNSIILDTLNLINSCSILFTVCVGRFLKYTVSIKTKILSLCARP